MHKPCRRIMACRPKARARRAKACKDIPLVDMGLMDGYKVAQWLTFAGCRYALRA